MGLESFCFFLRLRTLFIGGVLVKRLQAGYRVFPGLESSHRPVKVPSSGFLGSLASGLSNL